MSSRVEELLAAAVDGSGTDGLDPPQSRNEKLLFALNDKLDNVKSALAGKVDGPADGQAYQQLVTDAYGNAKWEDRLAYASVTETELMPEQTVAFSDYEGGAYMAEAPVSFNLNEGWEYKVTFDGQQYDCVCALSSQSMPYIGNISCFGGDDTGEPFLFLFTGEIYAWLSYDTNASHTIAVSGPDEKVTQINPKYLPRLNVVISGNDNDGYSSNYTAEEIRSAYYAGKTITGVYSINGSKRILTLKEPSEPGGIIDYFPVVFYEMVNAGDEFSYSVRDCYMYKEYRISSRGVTVYKPTRCLVLSSSTSGSTKKFKITVDDTGTISATEVT